MAIRGFTAIGGENIGQCRVHEMIGIFAVHILQFIVATKREAYKPGMYKTGLHLPKIKRTFRSIFM